MIFSVLKYQVYFLWSVSIVGSVRVARVTKRRIAKQVVGEEAEGTSRSTGAKWRGERKVKVSSLHPAEILKRRNPAARHPHSRVAP